MAKSESDKTTVVERTPLAAPRGTPGVGLTNEARDKVPAYEKAAWAAGCASDAVMTGSIGQLALPVYNMGLGMDAGLVGVAVAIPRFLDAFLDPIMGNLSDNTRTRWGRRRPYIFWGGILVTVLFWLTWCPPKSLGSWGIFIYLVLMSSLFFCAYTVFLIPHAALGFELTGDYHERTRVMAYRSFLGSVAGLALPYFLLWSKSSWFGGNTVDGIRWVTGIAGVIMMLAILSSAILCKERASSQTQNKMGLLQAMKCSLANGPFVIVLLVVMLATVACFLTAPFEIYVITYHVARGNEALGARIYGNTGCIYGILGIINSALLSYVATRVGKKATLLLGLATATIAFLLTLVFYTPGSPYLILVTKVLLNPGLTSIWLLSFSMIADICDVDELKNGLRREGMFGAMYNTLVIKIGISAVTFISGFCVKWSGYQPKTAPSAEVIRNLRFMYALVPAGMLIVAFILALAYPLTEERMRAVREKLAARRRSRIEVACPVQS